MVENVVGKYFLNIFVQILKVRDSIFAGESLL